MADTEMAQIETSVMDVVLSPEAKRRYKNGQPLPLYPKDLRDIVRLTMAKCADLASRPAEVEDEGPPIDCQGTPSSCPDNEGYGCHCGETGEAVEVDRMSITQMVSESMTKHGVKYQCGMGGMIVDIMEKFGIPPSHTTNKEK